MSFYIEKSKTASEIKKSKYKSFALTLLTAILLIFLFSLDNQYSFSKNLFLISYPILTVCFLLFGNQFKKSLQASDSQCIEIKKFTDRSQVITNYVQMVNKTGRKFTVGEYYALFEIDYKERCEIEKKEVQKSKNELYSI